ncbi:small GTPase superfamily, partial [Coprinopsis sp. MPI-PUGE-AT-0042]
LETVKRKLVITGDGGCGKTYLLVTFAKGDYPTEVYVPAVFENHVVDIAVTLSDGTRRRVQLALWDTAGQEDYDRLRPLAYAKAHVVLLYFEVDSREGFANIEDKWVPEIRHFCPGVPFVLVGCDTDLRADDARLEELRKKSQHPVSFEEGQTLAQKIGTKQYLECSPKKGEGVNEVLQCAAREALLCKVKRKNHIERLCAVL